MHYIYNPTLKRFFIFHFVFPFLLCGFLVLHIFNLHFLSSNNPLRNSTNNKIPFFPFIISKDFYGNILILYLYLLQIHFGFSSFSHPDNALEACGLLTPLLSLPKEGIQSRILQITVYNQEWLTIDCQGTNLPRSIQSSMDISLAVNQS